MTEDKYICTPEMSNRFYLIRRALNKSQKEMGPALGYSQSLYSRLENSVGCKVEKKLILLMCSLFDVNYDYLVNGEGPMFNSEKADRRAWMNLYDTLPKPYKDMFAVMTQALLDKLSKDADDKDTPPTGE